MAAEHAEPGHPDCGVRVRRGQGVLAGRPAQGFHGAHVPLRVIQVQRTYHSALEC